MQFLTKRQLATRLAAAAVFGLAAGGGLAHSQSRGPATEPAPGRPEARVVGADGPTADQAVEDRMRQARRDELARLRAPDADGDGEARDGRRAEPDPPSEAEWQAAALAMQELTPYWWRRFDRGPEQGPGRERVVRAVVNRYRELQRIKRRDPEQYDREVEQLKLEDEVLSLGRRLWRDPQRQDAAELRQQLRERVGQLVDLRIRNREARIARIAATLEQERERLEADKRNRDAVAERQYEAVLNRRPMPGMPPGPGGGPPGGRRGPGGPPGGLPDRPELAAPPPGPAEQQ